MVLIWTTLRAAILKRNKTKETMTSLTSNLPFGPLVQYCPVMVLWLLSMSFYLWRTGKGTSFPFPDLLPAFPMSLPPKSWTELDALRVQSKCWMIVEQSVHAFFLGTRDGKMWSFSASDSNAVRKKNSLLPWSPPGELSEWLILIRTIKAWMIEAFLPV